MARIVFDLDGTLIDSVPDIHGMANEILAQEGCELLSLDQTRKFIGNGAAVFVTRMREVRGIPDSEQARLLEDLIGRYEGAVTLTQPYPDAIETLHELKAKGHRLGICTNKPIRPCRAVLAHLNMDHFFDAILGGDSLPVHKPDPSPLNAVFEMLGEGPRIYVGDSDVDAETGQRAQVPFMLFTEGYRKCPVEEMPYTVAFDDFANFVELVESLLLEKSSA